MSSNDCQALLNCPFCGGEGKLKVADGILDDFTMFYCYCPNGKCIAGGTDWFRSREEAIEAWNTRAERTCTFETVVFEDGAFTHNVLECSNCGLHIEPEISGRVQSFVNYCPHCGAKVVS